MPSKPVRITFKGSQGTDLAARLDLPLGQLRGMALFAHCFTCSKDIFAAKNIASELAKEGIGVMRFDFTGLGHSDGEFANTNFSSNLEDLKRAAYFLNENYGGPDILIGHSLGGAAVLGVGGELPFVKAVVTIGAPAEPEHVIHNFGTNLDRINQDGEAEVSLAGRPFKIKKQFIEDVTSTKLKDKIKSLRKPLMVMHSPTDAIVGVENASAIFTAAWHPKSYISLEDADHLLSEHSDATFAAKVISGWASKHVANYEEENGDMEVISVGETGQGKFQQMVKSRQHRMLADEPISYGGMDTGPSPYDYLAIALGACTSMTIRVYAERKNFPLDHIETIVTHEKIHAADCVECDETYGNGKIDRFERKIILQGDLDAEMRQKMLLIADKCPVHKTLETNAVIATKLGS